MSDEIHQLISGFAKAFDAKDWQGLEALLSERVDVDYSDLRGEHTVQSRQDYVAKRREALAALQMRHVFTMLDVDVRGDTATCRVSGWIERRLGERFFNSDVVYRFGLERSGGAWRIRSIAQTVIRNEGDPSIHSGVKSPR
ncbi:MAG TPA: nuclear transport factor 2 family protein [Polyangiaceae bacterium]|nr:nuclear transport factor 2 family protein [Polyangiaceae bacterium]